MDLALRYPNLKIVVKLPKHSATEAIWDSVCAPAQFLEVVGGLWRTAVQHKVELGH